MTQITHHRYSTLLPGLLLCIVALLNPGNIAAAEKEAYLLSQSTHKALLAIQKQMEEEQYRLAEKALNSLLGTLDKKPYDRAVSLQTLAYLHSNRGDYKQAVRAFSQALSLNALPDDVTHTLRYNYSQLLIFTESYREGLKQLERWMVDEKKPSTDALYLAANAHYQLENYQASARYLEQLLKSGKPVEKSWLQILLACYFELKQYKSASGILLQLVKLEPGNKTYWQQLVASYQHMDYQKSALATMELMYQRKMLDAEELLRLGKMYLYHGMPYKAANLLQHEIDQSTLKPSLDILNLLADSWIIAKEPQQAILVLERALDLAVDGQIHFRLGQLLVEMERWAEAQQVFTVALQKGQLREKGSALLLLGISAWKSGKTEQSVQALRQALEHQSSRDQAEWWMDYIKRRRAELAS